MRLTLGQGSNESFFEKKDQKAFAPRLHRRPRQFRKNKDGRTIIHCGAGGETKAFWSFFSKKDYFPPRFDGSAPSRIGMIHERAASQIRLLHASVFRMLLYPGVAFPFYCRDSLVRRTLLLADNGNLTFASAAKFQHHGSVNKPSQWAVNTSLDAAH